MIALCYRNATPYQYIQVAQCNEQGYSIDDHFIPNIFPSNDVYFSITFVYMCICIRYAFRIDVAGVPCTFSTYFPTLRDTYLYTYPKK